MKTVGIIAEYNPFHNGHLYHITEAKRLTNADFAVVIMSGNFVQRGTPAILDKYSRTKMALACGADLVFELPVQYATATAELFAHGAVSLLNSLGFVDYLCFGSEHTTLSDYQKLAQLLENPPLELKKLLEDYQKQNISYPVARSKAIHAFLAKEENLDILSFLSKPNTILGIAYLQALLRLGSNITPVILKRTDKGYHSFELKNSIASASGIRKAYQEQKSLYSLSDYIPDAVFSILKKQEKKTFPIEINDFSSLLYYKLLSNPPKERYTDITMDFWNRIYKSYNYCTSFSQLCDIIKCKNLVYSSICRNLLHILLDTSTPDKTDNPEYLRLLGFKKEASWLLNAKRQASNPPLIPIITKVADAKKILSAKDYTLFEEDIKASHLYNHICHEKFGYCVKPEYQQGPIIL